MSLEQLKASLKTKWLNYYQINRNWIKETNDFTSTPDQGRRPSDLLMVGIIGGLEPQMSDVLLNFFKVKASYSKVIQALELNFDPDKKLEETEAKIAEENSTANIVFDPLSLSLKEKWLNYYQIHGKWLKHLVEDLKRRELTPDGKYPRPQAALIIGVMAALEPKLKDILLSFFLVNKDYTSALNGLGLNFDSDTELEKKLAEEAEKAAQEITQEVIENNDSIDKNLEDLMKGFMNR